MPAHASLFTGAPPRVHRADQENLVVSSALPLLTQELRALGFHTAGFSANIWVGKHTGLERGFEHFRDLSTRIYKPHVRALATDRAGRHAAPEDHHVVAPVLEWLAKTPSDSRPFFLFVNLIEPHMPYLPDTQTAAPFVPGAAARWRAIHECSRGHARLARGNPARARDHRGTRHPQGLALDLPAGRPARGQHAGLRPRAAGRRGSALQADPLLDRERRALRPARGSWRAPSARARGGRNRWLGRAGSRARAPAGRDPRTARGEGRGATGPGRAGRAARTGIRGRVRGLRASRASGSAATEEAEVKRGTRPRCFSRRAGRRATWFELARAPRTLGTRALLWWLAGDHLAADRALRRHRSERSRATSSDTSSAPIRSRRRRSPPDRCQWPGGRPGARARRAPRR
ncbi:MAG: sulfatase-like hydrolase/transferase [Planctomycetes bacterium]|nr:sulfatase-like hydrolase/transferase [Planctomycetota bacterium]